MNKNLTKKIFLTALALLLVLGSVPTTVFANDYEEEALLSEELAEEVAELEEISAIFELFTWRRPLFNSNNNWTDFIPNRMPATGPRTELERDMDVLVNQFGQRLFASPNEHAASAYIADRFREAGSSWEVEHHVWDRSAHPESWPAGTRGQPFSGRLAFGGDLPDIYGAPFPNNEAWGSTIEGAILVDLGLYPNLALPPHVEALLASLPEGASLSIIGAIRYTAYPHNDTPGGAHAPYRHQFDVANLGPVIEGLEVAHQVNIEGILLAAAGRQNPEERQLVDYNVESLTPGMGSQNHGMVAPQLPDAAANTPRPMIAMPLHFLEQAIERADQFQYAERYHRTHDNTVIATRPAPNGNPDIIIVVTAHLDSVLASQGAADNATGTAALLEIAREFANRDLGNIELRLAAVGAHEGGGMTGSRWIIEHLTPEERAITINLNMDIIASVGPSLIDGRPINAISMDINQNLGAGMPFGFNLPAHLVVSGARDVWTPGDQGIDNVRIFNFGGSEHVRFTENGIDAASMIMIDDADNDLELQYHNARDNMAENYCADRLRLSVDLMLNALDIAVNQEITKRATFHVDSENDTLILANATQLFQTFDLVEGELLIDETVVPFIFEYPATTFDFSAYREASDAEYVVRDVISSGVGIADHDNAERNSQLNLFTSRTVAEITPMPIVTGVTVTPDAVVASPGDDVQFSAVVEGEYDPSQAVTWVVEVGADDVLAEGTSISADGLLTVAEGQVDALMVRAISVVDAEFYGTATVEIELAVLVHEVNFNLHGGQWVFDEDEEIDMNQLVLHGELATEPAVDPEKDGYTFIGWFTTEEGDTSFDFETVIVADTIVHAQWESVADNGAGTGNRPNLPDTGAVVGSLLLGGIALTAAGLGVASKKKKSE
ncbi:MAG: M28 family peptidase [Turicibacter sp.]|nr:M28 family peptidase [Turicibacter sp.]